MRTRSTTAGRTTRCPARCVALVCWPEVGASGPSWRFEPACSTLGRPKSSDGRRPARRRRHCTRTTPRASRSRWRGGRARPSGSRAAVPALGPRGDHVAQLYADGERRFAKPWTSPCRRRGWCAEEPRVGPFLPGGDLLGRARAAPRRVGSRPGASSAPQSPAHAPGRAAPPRARAARGGERRRRAALLGASGSATRRRAGASVLAAGATRSRIPPPRRAGHPPRAPVAVIETEAVSARRGRRRSRAHRAIGAVTSRGTTRPPARSPRTDAAYPRWVDAANRASPSQPPSPRVVPTPSSTAHRGQVKLPARSGRRRPHAAPSAPPTSPPTAPDPSRTSRAALAMARLKCMRRRLPSPRRRSTLDEVSRRRGREATIARWPKVFEHAEETACQRSWRVASRLSARRARNKRAEPLRARVGFVRRARGRGRARRRRLGQRTPRRPGAAAIACAWRRAELAGPTGAGTDSAPRCARQRMIAADNEHLVVADGRR